MGLILAFDPGATSGVCGIEHITGRDFQLVMSFEYAWQERFKIFNLIYAHRLNIKALVIERYRLFENRTTLHAQIGSEIPSARVIGIIELSAAICRLNCITFQDPSDRNSVSVLPEHRALIHRSKHCIDAYKHARFYVLTKARKENDGKSN